MDRSLPMRWSLQKQLLKRKPQKSVSLSLHTSNINDTFFNGHYKEVWRKLIPPGLSEAECSFVEDVAGLQKGDAVLDLMCGYGRHALELARRGYSVTAIDNSQAYIAEIEQRAGIEDLTVEGIAGGALETPLHQSYKAMLCMGNSFAFFSKADALLLLQKLSTYLEPTGIFIINTWMIAEIAMRHFKERDWYAVDEYKYLLDYKFCFQPNRIESEHTIISPDNTVEVIHGVDYVLTLDELQEMFEKVGLQLKDIYSTPKKRTFRMGDNKAYIVVQKQAKRVGS